MKLSFHENPKLQFGVVFFGFVFLSIIIAVGPATWVMDHNKPLPGMKELTAQQQAGYDIFVSEGCPYCHTQQVRPLKEDQPFGRPSAPGDYALLRPLDFWRMTPELLGTERTGPDLSNVGNRQSSETWNYIHLYNPRAVVKASVMQAYPWLFEIKQNPDSNDTVVPVPKDFAPAAGKVVVARNAKELVAYILSRKQVPIKGMESGAKSSSQQSSSGAAQSGASAESQLGNQVYGSHCSSCHQSNGHGIPSTFPPLKGDPVVTAKDPTRHVQIVLFGLQGKTINGVKYSATMPSHVNTLSAKQVAAVVNHERTSWGNNAPTVTVQQVEKIIKEGKPKGLSQ
ncbi:MAG: cbb3-type cytochrome c oxidase subunit II [Calditrichia bacterium]